MIPSLALSIVNIWNFVENCCHNLLSILMLLYRYLSVSYATHMLLLHILLEHLCIHQVIRRTCVNIRYWVFVIVTTSANISVGLGLIEVKSFWDLAVWPIVLAILTNQTFLVVQVRVGMCLHHLSPFHFVIFATQSTNASTRASSFYWVLHNYLN